ncbi:hypothetical protein ABIC08_009263 [Bradyrhizobium sp. RT9b]|uniref:hypothetical protein n=1 Tax=Bradyrhizobium sp. RT9b TaxID=3156385 RepID=UPI0033974AB4
MAETLATIIDFNAYRMRKRPAAKLPRDLVRSNVPGAVVPLDFFWPFWIPFGLLDLALGEWVSHEQSWRRHGALLQRAFAVLGCLRL